MIMVWNGGEQNKHTWISHKQTHMFSSIWEKSWVYIKVGH